MLWALHLYASLSLGASIGGYTFRTAAILVIMFYATATISNLFEPCVAPTTKCIYVYVCVYIYIYEQYIQTDRQTDRHTYIHTDMHIKPVAITFLPSASQPARDSTAHHCHVPQCRNQRACVCVYIYIYIYTHIYTYTYTYVYVYIYIYIYRYTYTYRNILVWCRGDLASASW